MYLRSLNPLPHLRRLLTDEAFLKSHVEALLPRMSEMRVQRKADIRRERQKQVIFFAVLAIGGMLLLHLTLVLLPQLARRVATEDAIKAVWLRSPLLRRNLHWYTPPPPEAAAAAAAGVASRFDDL